MAAGVLGGVGLLGGYFVDATRDVEGLTRIEIGSQGAIEVDDPGELAVYHEYDGASSDHLDRPLPGVTVVDPSGAPVEVVPVEGQFGYTLAGHEGESVFRFESEEAGTYEVTTQGEPDATIAVGQPLGDALLWVILGTIALILGGIFAGVLILGPKPGAPAGHVARD